MSGSQQPLWQKLRAFEIDEPGVTLTFVHRLARKNGWRHSYAERVVQEYKKFLYLAMVAGHEVTPSEQVDQAWHLHLTYTRSYWDRLCGQTLGRPLHHGPTKGGNAEQQKYIALYEQTLASYREHFGYAPPSDIWSDTDTRFGDDLAHVTVPRSKYWIILKPRWSLPRAPGWMFGVAGLPLLGFGWNPLRFTGPNFLLFYFICCMLALILALLARHSLRAWSQARDKTKQKPLSPYEAACLAGGPQRAVEAAVASMIQSGMLRLEEQHKAGFLGKQKVATIQQGDEPGLHAAEIERAIFDTLHVPAKNVSAVQTAAKEAARDIEERLVRRGLLYAPESLLPAQFVSALVMASPLLVGVPKLVFGLELHKPIAILLPACIATLIAAIIMFVWKPYRTPSGTALLSEYRQKFAPQRLQAKLSTAEYSCGELGMLVGLYGASMLASSPMQPLFRPESQYHGSGDGGCGGGGCGGGGCGGGGCGGCGGCGG